MFDGFFLYGPKRPFLSMLLSLGLYWTVWDRFMQVLYLGRAPRTKETLPDFLKWRRVARPPLVFRGLTGSQRTPGFRGVTNNTMNSVQKSHSINRVLGII